MTQGVVSSGADRPVTEPRAGSRRYGAGSSVERRAAAGMCVAPLELMTKIELGFLSLSLLASTSLAAGCRQKVESTDVRTSGVFPVIDVSADGSGSTRVQVKLKVGGPASNTFLDLTGEDRLTATAGGVTKDLDGSGGTSVSYSATFPTEAAGPFVIAFMRGPADTDAPATTVDLPAPFTVALAAREISRASGDLAFTWTPAGTGDLDLSLYGSCIDIVLQTIPDDGTATISGDQIHAQTATDACTATLALARTRSGTVDPAFTEGGDVSARQLRSVTFTSTP